MISGQVDIVSLGCSKNLVDTERLIWHLQQAGFNCTIDSADPKAEIAVINTCGFIGDAKEESINTILQFAERKKKHRLRRLYVMGCLSERYKEELQSELPEVDKFYGKFDFLNLVSDLATAQSGCSQGCMSEYKRTLTPPSHYAYLKVAEGCDRRCSYCAIPLITGKYTSRPIEQIVEETRWLVSQGVHEFQVIAQDLTYYGSDIYGKSKIAELVTRLSDIEGVEWIRLHYAYPTAFPFDLLPVIRERHNVCKYLDIALQHASDNVLSLMHRHITKAEQTAVIERIRREVPGIYLRTTMMVGHPGETEDDFKDMLEWVKQMRFERLGAFAYSDEEGTYANLNYQDDVPPEVKQNRLDTLMALQEQIADRINQTEVGKTLKVIIDRQEDNYYIGRTEHDSPEVDCEVLITAEQPLPIGQFCNVLITDADTFDLYAKPIL